MEYRAFFALAVFWLIMGHTEGQAYPCFAAERVSRYERRFFAFVPSNVRSEPPVECTFVFGGPPGSRLRMAAYDVRTKDDKLGEEGECRRNSLRVYDVGIRGIQLMATYCGAVRRGQMLTMSSNMAVVTFTSDNNSLNNAFSLIVDAVEKNILQPIPCPNPVTEDNQEETSSEDNITPTYTLSTTESTDSTEFSPENQSTSENVGKESIISTTGEEENQSFESSTETIDRDYNSTEAQTRESQETASEYMIPDEIDEDESQLYY